MDGHSDMREEEGCEQQVNSGRGELYEYMYVHTMEWDEMGWHFCLICIDYFVLRLDVGPLLQEEGTGSGVALPSCHDKGRIAILQYHKKKRDRETERDQVRDIQE